MAKEQLHNWGRYILLAIVIIFGSGGWAAKVVSNTNTISENRSDSMLADISLLKKVEKSESSIENLKGDVHKMELNAKDIKSLAAEAVKTGRESVRMFEKIQLQLEEKSRIDSAIQLDIGKMQVKMEVLVKE